MNKKLSVLLSFLAIILAQPAIGQKMIKLTNIETGKVLLIKSGARVAYTAKTHWGSIKKARVTSIADSVVVLNNIPVKLHQITSIGRKRSGSGFFSTFSVIVGTSAFISGIMPDPDPCPECIDAGSTGAGYAVAEVFLGAGLLYLGVNSIIRNTPKNVDKWTLEIVDNTTNGK
jgi:hypothetical protein